MIDVQRGGRVALRVQVDDEHPRAVLGQQAARLTAVVVLPTPPFWLAIVMTRQAAAGATAHAPVPRTRPRPGRPGRSAVRRAGGISGMAAARRSRPSCCPRSTTSPCARPERPESPATVPCPPDRLDLPRCPSDAVLLPSRLAAAGPARPPTPRPARRPAAGPAMPTSPPVPLGHPASPEPPRPARHAGLAPAEIAALLPAPPRLANSRTTVAARSTLPSPPALRSLAYPAAQHRPGLGDLLPAAAP